MKKTLFILLMILLCVSCSDSKYHLVIKNIETDSTVVDTVCTVTERSGWGGQDTYCDIECKPANYSDTLIYVYKCVIYDFMGYSRIYFSSKPIYVQKFEYVK